MIKITLLTGLFVSAHMLNAASDDDTVQNTPKTFSLLDDTIELEGNPDFDDVLLQSSSSDRRPTACIGRRCPAQPCVTGAPGTAGDQGPPGPQGPKGE